MTVQVELVAEGRTHLGTHRLRRGLFALGALPRFLHCDIALVEGDLSAMADRCEDLATFLLGAAVMLPAIEIRPTLHDDDIGPARLAIEVRLLLDLGHLRRPDGIGTRPEARRVGKECVSPVSSRWSVYH